MLAYAEYNADSHSSDPAAAARRLLRQAMTAAPRPLAPEEIGFARTAWAYFDRGCGPCTGLPPATGSGRHTTISAVGATLLAITSADLLGLLPTRTARDRVALILRAVAQLASNNRGRPVAAFDSTTLRPADGVAPAQGPALMRLIAGFIICAHHYPVLAPDISEILDGWDLAPLLTAPRCRKDAIGVWPDPYSRRVAALVGLPVAGGEFSNLARGKHRASPIYLETLEFGWQAETSKHAATLFLAERARFTTQGRLTARGIDPAPGIGKMPAPACVLTNAAFGWHAIFPTPYSTKLLDAVRSLARPQGWLTGYFEATGKPNETLSLNTNAEILEALHYRARGPLLTAAT